MIEKETEESNKHYEFYLVYQNMGYKRTLKKVAEEVQLTTRVSGYSFKDSTPF